MGFLNQKSLGKAGLSQGKTGFFVAGLVRPFNGPLCTVTLQVGTRTDKYPPILLKKRISRS